MRKQTCFLTCCFIFLSLSLSAQKGPHIDQSFGLAGSTSNVTGTGRLVTDTSVVDSKFSLTLRQFGIVYYPRIDMLEWKTGSLSIGSPMMLGFSISSKYRSTDFDGTTTKTVEGVNGLNLAFQVPVVVDLNIGLHSAQDESNKHFGFYVGAGYGYTYTKIKTSVGRITYDQFEPVLRTGIRLGKAWENRLTIGFNIRNAFQANTIRAYELHFVKDI